MKVVSTIHIDTFPANAIFTSDMTLSVGRRRLYIAATTIVSVIAVVIGWELYYSHYNRACFDKAFAAEESRIKGFGAPDENAFVAGCNKFVPLERFVCEHAIPVTGLIGGCGVLGARYVFGVGVPRDPGQSIALLRRDCVSYDYDSGSGCTLVWGRYNEAFSHPHYVILWSGHFDGNSYIPYWARNLDEVLVEAEGLCASDFPGSTIEPDRHALLRSFCAELSVARLAIDDARAHGSELIRLCDSGNQRACHLAGFLLTFGIGLPRDFERGKALLKGACEHGISLACEDVGMNDGKGTLLKSLEAALSGTPAPTVPH